MNELPEELIKKIEFDSCVLLVSQYHRHVHKELSNTTPLLYSFIETPIDCDVEYSYADRLPALIRVDD